MDIRNPRSLRDAAADALRVGRDPKQVILYYSGIIALLGFLLAAADYVLSVQLAKATGLSNLGINSLLSAIQSFLPMVQVVILLCLELGYQYAMLRVGRKLYADRNDLKEGFRRFGPLLRCTLMQFFVYMAVAMVLMYPVMVVYLMTPLADPLIELLAPMLTADTTQLVIDEAMYLQMMDAMMPMMLIYMPLYFAAVLPVQFYFRMANYLLADRPGTGGFAALRGSFRMMRRNCLKMLKVDLHLWWYHGLILLMSLIAYGNQLLPWLGIPLPWSSDLSLFIFQALYLLGTFAVNYFFRNPVELTYVMAYETLRPKEPKQNGVVLGNIFQM